MKTISIPRIQQNIKILLDKQNFYTLVDNWQPKTMLIPYNEELKEIIEDYFENLEMQMNKKNVIKKWKESLESWLSNFVI